MRTRTWVATATTMGILTVTVAGIGVRERVLYSNVSHAPVVQASQTVLSIDAAPSPTADASTMQNLASELDNRAGDPRVGNFGGVVIDSTSGKVMWSSGASTPLRPASTTKLLTAAAALLALPQDARLVTTLTRDDDGTVIIKAGGDVMLTEEKLSQLADAAPDATAVAIDTSVWAPETFNTAWNKADIAGGYIAPMEPLMLYGARIGGNEGDVPRSTTPAQDVGEKLAEMLAVPFVGEKPAASTEVGRVYSDPLTVRLHDMMAHSDNVMAEAIAREIAMVDDVKPTILSARQTVLSHVEFTGISTAEVKIDDCSGLAVTNAISAETFANLLVEAINNPTLRPLLDVLPIGGGEGSLGQRYWNKPAQGRVRAKTGTLTDTASLAGVVTAKSGRSYVFAFICNDTDVTGARNAMDEMVNYVREEG